MKYNFFEFNKLSYLHDEKNIFFCKTDFILKDFEKIKNLKNNVILITGNSDYAITDEILAIAPKNIKKWYATNCIPKDNVFEPIPLGLENENESRRKEHGIGHGNISKIKKELLTKNKSVIPDKFIYANFRIETNPSYRTVCKEICKKIKHIDVEENGLPLEIFFNKILEYRMVFCPIGNGIDTHRLWETLYSNRIPIIIKIGNFKIYELYEKLPIIILDKIEDLSNKDLIEYKAAKLNYNNLNILDINYWITDIQSSKLN